MAGSGAALLLRPVRNGADLFRCGVDCRLDPACSPLCSLRYLELGNVSRAVTELLDQLIEDHVGDGAVVGLDAALPEQDFLLHHAAALDAQFEQDALAADRILDVLG